MKDRELLFMAYGAMQAAQTVDGGVDFSTAMALIEEHLWPKYDVDKERAKQFETQLNSIGHSANETVGTF